MATREEKRRIKSNNELIAQIGYFLAKEKYTKRMLAQEMGMSEATLYNKLRNPDNFSLGETRDLICILHLENNIKLAII